MRALYYDCFAGISGDMNLGAMIDLGVDFDHLCSQLALLKLENEFKITAHRDSKQGIFGTKVTVTDLNHHDHSHDHHHHHNHLRDYKQIKDLIESSELSQRVKALSLDIFNEIAVAEAHVHNKSIEDVHFHEVGAIDSIVDVVGAAICYEALGLEMVLCSTIEVGSGFVKCDHGWMPIPAPATAEILKGLPIQSRIEKFEMTTPTGAAIIKALSDSFTDDKKFSIEKVGYGLGTRDLEIPNLLRAMIVNLPDKKKMNPFNG